MTARTPITVLGITRLITAFEKKGYRIAGATPDGKLIVYSGDDRPDELSINRRSRKGKEAASWDDR